MDCKVLQHAVNLGKGRALKNGFNEFLNLYQDNPDILGIITVDSDGQHVYVIKKDKSVIVGLSAMLGGWIIYLISLLILYQFSYTKSEAVYLASFHRYNSTYMVALVMVLEISILYYFRNKNKTLIVCAIAVLLNCNLFSVISPVLEFLGEMPEHEEFTDVTDQITENDKIFFVDQNSDNINYLIFRYEVTPVHINENSDSYSLGEGKYDENGKLIEDSWKKFIRCRIGKMN